MQYSSVSLLKHVSSSVSPLRSSVLGRRCLSSDTLTTVRREGGVEHITLANPKTRNALSLDMMKKITEDISRAGEDKTVRTIVLRGEGQVGVLVYGPDTDHVAGVLCRAQPQGDDGGDRV